MKTKTITLTLVSVLMCFVMVLTLGACTEDTSADNTKATNAATQDIDPLWKGAMYTEDTSIGEGATSINVKIEAGEKSITITLNTDKETLEAALLDAKLIEGDESQYGLFIKKVNGIEADYDKDQTYWAIFKDGEYLMEGANKTIIAQNDNFELVRTK